MQIVRLLYAAFLTAGVAVPQTSQAPVLTVSGNRFRVILNMVGPNAGVSLGAGKTSGWGISLYTVPADQQGIVEFVTMDCRLPNPSAMIDAALSLSTEDPGTFNEKEPSFRLVVLDQGVADNVHYFAVSQTAKIYVNPGEGFGIGMTQANPAPTNEKTNCLISVTGTLLPALTPGAPVASQKPRSRLPGERLARQ